MEDSKLILPGHPDFDYILATNLPFNHSDLQSATTITYVADSETGILRPANEQEFKEYVYGGEYDEIVERTQALDCLGLHEGIHIDYTID